jgi:hypothetical protein
VSLRLAIVGLPRLLADLITVAFDDDDDLSVEQFAEYVPVTSADARWTEYDVIVVGITDPERNPAVEDISGITRPRILGVRTDGRDSWIYRMRPHPQRFGVTSPAHIRTAVLAERNPST